MRWWARGPWDDTYHSFAAGFNMYYMYIQNITSQIPNKSLQANLLQLYKLNTSLIFPKKSNNCILRVYVSSGTFTLTKIFLDEMMCHVLTYLLNSFLYNQMVYLNHAKRVYKRAVTLLTYNRVIIGRYLWVLYYFNINIILK